MGSHAFVTLKQRGPSLHNRKVTIKTQMSGDKCLSEQTIIYLMRKDLRLHDNECFNYIAEIAHKTKESTDFTLRLIPVYCFESEEYLNGTCNYGFRRIGQHRLRFLIETLNDLKSQLKCKGSDLILRSFRKNKENGNPTQVILNIIEHIGLKCKKSDGREGDQSNCTLIFHREATEEEKNIEHSLLELCRNYGIHVITFWGSSLYHIDDLPFDTISRNGSQIPNVPDTFTSFRSEVESKSKIRALIEIPENLPPLPENIISEEMPCDTELLNASGINATDYSFEVSNKSAFPFKGGELAALERVNDYLWGSNGITTYKETRNRLIGTQYSTKFSSWLANGSLSPRYVHDQIKKYEDSKIANQSTYWVIFQLLWRDFFRFVTLKAGNTIFQAKGIRGRDVAYKKDPDLFDRWKNGKTGVPFVDANMREMLLTGWMSNRGRQNVASFLVKDLNLEWRLGAEWFESQLIDYDVCSNYGNWNYAAGVGNDPRVDRKFNIIKQGLDYDPSGDYVKTWVPELAKLTEQNSLTKGVIHFPWKANITDLNNAKIELGISYPNPIIIAGEWERHYSKVINKAGGAANTKELQQKKGSDFYFKQEKDS